MTDDTRTYGMAVERDPEGRARDGDPGEAPKHVADPHPEFTHGLPGEGHTILVEEDSGVAFAEVTGAAGVRAPEPEDAPEAKPAPKPATPVPVRDEAVRTAPPLLVREADRAVDVAIALVLVAAVGLVAALRRATRRRTPERRDAPAAFAHPVTDGVNFAQVRESGPEAMRDAAHPAWDRTDEALDETFPCSDPPATY